MSGKKAPSVSIINTAVDTDIELDAIRLLILLLSINLDQVTLLNHVNKYNWPVSILIAAYLTSYVIKVRTVVRNYIAHQTLV